MIKRLLVLTCFILIFIYGVVAQRDRVEAVEIGRHNTDLLLEGKEADGIVGDFVLRNNRIEALISGGQPLRRANWRTEVGYVLQGCLFDLDLRGEKNDQITAFRPGGEGGEMSSVRVAEDGSNGAAVIEAVRTAAKGDGLYTRHEYRLERDWQHVLVTSTYRNDSEQAKNVTPQPLWKGFSKQWEVEGIRVADSTDPFDKRAYAWGTVPPGAPLAEELQLQPGEEKTYQLALAVADSPLAGYGVIAALAAPTGEVSGTVADPENSPAVYASLMVSVAGETLSAYPDKESKFSFRLPVGQYRLQVQDIGRDPVEQAFSVERDRQTPLTLAVQRASAVRVEVRNERGAYSPAKVLFIGIEGTPNPNLGPLIRARGGDNGYLTHTGRFTQQVPPGRYLVRIRRGPEHDLVEKTIEVAKERTVEVQATLQRTVDTTGWVATDYHSHSTPSGDNYCNTDDRIINHVAEHIEFAPSTEHNRIDDWAPRIERLGLSRHLKTVVGLELSGSGSHFNSFPLREDRFAQNGGAPVWNYDPRINAIVLRNWGTPSLESQGSRYDTEANASSKVPWFAGGPERWVQINHPKFGVVFFDRNQDQVVDGGFAGLENLIDAAENWTSTDLLNFSPAMKGYWGGRWHDLENPTFGWLQLLNQGRGVWCVAVSDAHTAFGESSVGGWRTYVPSSTDEPSEIDPAEIIRRSKAGRMMITNGPFLEVTTADGLPIGSKIVAAGYVDLKVRVQAADWVEVDRVQVLVNSRQAPEYNYTRQSHPHMFRDGVVRFDETLRINLQQDAHLIVVATSDHADMSKGWQRDWQSEMNPLAYTNPIYVDVDGNGFQANGDTLGRPLIVHIPDPPD